MLHDAADKECGIFPSSEPEYQKGVDLITFTYRIVELRVVGGIVGSYQPLLLCINDARNKNKKVRSSLVSLGQEQIKPKTIFLQYSEPLRFPWRQPRTHACRIIPEDRQNNKDSHKCSNTDLGTQHGKQQQSPFIFISSFSHFFFSPLSLPLFLSLFPFGSIPTGVPSCWPRGMGLQQKEGQKSNERKKKKKSSTLKLE